MLLKDFLKKYRSEVNKATGKVFSIRMLAELIGVKEHNLAKWELKGSIPSSDYDRLSMKIFFGIDNFENIGEKILKDSIERYPNPLGKMEGTGDESITLAQFIHKYIDGVSKITGKSYSFADMTNTIYATSDYEPSFMVDFAKRLESWANDVEMPTEDEDVIRMKYFFGITNFENIPAYYVEDAILAYPNKRDFSLTPKTDYMNEIHTLRQQLRDKEELIKEKDARIQDKEEIIKMLRSQKGMESHSIQDKSKSQAS